LIERLRLVAGDAVARGPGEVLVEKRGRRLPVALRKRAHQGEIRVLGRLLVVGVCGRQRRDRDGEAEHDGFRCQETHGQLPDEEGKLRLASERAQFRRGERDHSAVPPTVIRSIRSVGWPTPTGTPWPFLPQVPMPGSSARSLPTMAMRLRSVGPLPISIAPFTGAPTLPSSTL